MSSAAAKAGWPVHINDHLYSSVVMSLSRVASTLAAPFESFGGIGSATEHLNAVEPVHGFIWREYSPASELQVGTKRMYFTEKNAAKIDGIRCEISRLVVEQRVSKLEEKLLLAALMRSANAIANTAGTYGCFLSKWQRQSKVDLRLEPIRLLDTHSDAAYTIGDASDVSTSAGDTVYLDPPYTKRQYAAYYHVLETIALGDEPEVDGVLWHSALETQGIRLLLQEKSSISAGSLDFWSLCTSRVAVIQFASACAARRAAGGVVGSRASEPNLARIHWPLSSKRGGE